MSYLMVSTSDGQSFRFTFEESSVRIGRSHENDLVLSDPTVSRLHASIERRSGGTYLVDMASRAGTYLNGQRVTNPHLIEAGDEIHVGDVTLTFDAAPRRSVRIADAMPLQTTGVLALEEVLPTPTDPLLRTEERDIMHLVLDADAELVVDRPLADLYRNLLDLAHRAVPFDRAAVMTLEDGRLVPQAERDLTGSCNGPIQVSSAIAMDAIGSKKAVLVENLSADPVYGRRSSVAGQQLRSAMCVPLWDRRRVRGIVYLDSGRESRPFTHRGLQVLTHLAHVAAVKLEHKRLFDEAVRVQVLEEEVRKAAEIQSQFLPASPPEIPGYRIHAASRPCFAVGGDFFNYFQLGDRRYGVVLGDVAGHGLASALLMCSFQTLLAALTDDGADPGRIVGRLNRLLCQRMPVNRFITLFFGVLDPREHRMTYVNAGQDVPFLVRPGGSIVELAPSGLPLGITDDAQYPARAVAVPPDGVFVSYSDGLTELRDVSGEEFSAKRLQAVSAAVARKDPQAIVDCVLQEADDHAGDVANHDDVTLLVVKRDGSGNLESE